EAQERIMFSSSGRAASLLPRASAPRPKRDLSDSGRLRKCRSRGKPEMDAAEGTVMMAAPAARLYSALTLSSFTRRAYVTKSPRTSRENASALPPTGSWPDCRKPSRTADSASALLISALRRAAIPGAVPAGTKHADPLIEHKAVHSGFLIGRHVGQGRRAPLRRLGEEP